VIDHLWANVDKHGPAPDHRPDLGPCWTWTGYTSGFGYGRVKLRSGAQRTANAHRVFYECLVGPIPDGLQLDHLCRVRNCVNPDHLEPVTQRENVLRGVGLSAVNARKTHCSQGHPLSGDNLKIEVSGRRRCLACRREVDRRRDARRRRTA